MAGLDFSRGADPCCYTCHGSGWDDLDGPNLAGVCGCVDMDAVRAPPEKRSGVEQAGPDYFTEEMLRRSLASARANVATWSDAKKEAMRVLPEPEKRSGVEQFDAPIPDKPHVAVKRDDGTILILSWEEARRAHDAFDRAVLERDLRRSPLGKR